MQSLQPSLLSYMHTYMHFASFCEFRCMVAKWLLWTVDVLFSQKLDDPRARDMASRGRVICSVPSLLS